MFFATCTIAFRNELWSHTFIIGKKTLNYTVTWRKQRKPNSFVWLPIKTHPFSFFSESRKLLQHSRDILHVHLHVLAYQLEDDSIFSNVHGKIELSQKISSSYVWLLQLFGNRYYEVPQPFRLWCRPNVCSTSSWCARRARIKILLRFFFGCRRI